MRTNAQGFAASAIVLAVRAAMMAMVAVPMIGMAQDAPSDEVKALISPTNYFEIGLGGVSKDSAKFGEYNGLDSSGAYAVGNFDVRGGDAYGQGSGLRRWAIYGTDLGTTSRSLGASIGDQGVWKLGIGYDQLRHHITDTYQTPFVGAMGDNSFTLPASFGVVNTGGSGTRALTPAQLAMFHTEHVYSERKNATFSAAYNFNRNWGVKLDFSQLNQSGAKLIGSGTDAYNTTATGGMAWGGERIAILMTPTNYKTETFNLSLDWVGEKAYASLAYFGSLFDDANAGLSWSNPFVANSGAWVAPATGTSPGAGGFPVDTMSTPPSNAFHQFSLTGGYAFDAKTHLSGGLSYGRNTQDAAYAGTYTTTPNTAAGLPVASLGGLVVNTHADLKLTHQASSALNLVAGLKYNERDNQTASSQYTFRDLGGVTTEVTNAPMSYRRTQLELAAEYRIDPRQRLHVGYDYEQMQRWCNNAAANNAQGFLSAVNTGYYTTASCVQVPEDKESKLSLGYKLKASDNVSVNAGYSYGKRDATVNSSFYNPMQVQDGGEGFENFGYVAFFDASRTEQQVKLGVNVQARENLNLGLNARYQDDKYGSTLGVQNGRTSSINVDAAYTVSETSSLSAYASWQDRTRDLLSANGRNAVAALPNLWTNHMDDQEGTIGIGGRQDGLLHGKLALREDLSYSLGSTGYSTQLRYASTTCVATSNLSCGALPNFKNESARFRVNGTYKLNKVSDVLMGYSFQRLDAQDYFYNVYQTGYTASTLLPTNQLAPTYTINSLFVAYRYRFQ